MIFHSLSSRLIFFVVGVFLISMIAFSYYSIKTQKEQLLKEVTRSADRFCDTIARSTRYDMLNNHSEGAREIMREVGAQDGVFMVRTFNKEGKITFSTNNYDNGMFVDKQAEACYLCHAAEKPLTRLSTNKRSRIFNGREGNRVLAMILPIYNEPDCFNAACHAHPKEQKVLGVLDVGMSLETVDAEIWASSLRMILLTVFIGVVIAGAVGFLIRKHVHKPVIELSKAMSIVASGDLDYEVQTNYRDEIAQLAKSFNKMTQDFKKMQGQMIASEKLASIGTLSAAIAHELNSPLTAIYTMLEILAQDTVNDSQIQNDLEFVLKEVKRCTEIVRRLLEFTRKSEPDKTNINMDRLMRETARIVEHQAYLRNVEIKLDIEQNIPHIKGDASQLKQVLLNLILNAIQAINDKGIVTVKAQKKDKNNLLLQISDTGVGIPEDKLQAVFEPFFTTKEPGFGTGLGLAISKDIIDAHGGTLKLASQVDKGTTISLELPIC